MWLKSHTVRHASRRYDWDLRRLGLVIEANTAPEVAARQHRSRQRSIEAVNVSAASAQQPHSSARAPTSSTMTRRIARASFGGCRSERGIAHIRITSPAVRCIRCWFRCGLLCTARTLARLEEASVWLTHQVTCSTKTSQPAVLRFTTVMVTNPQDLPSSISVCGG
jgi:hypothetical protein